MPRFEVEIPFCGYARVIVEADDPNAAIENARTIGAQMTIVDFDDPDNSIEVMDWSFFPEIARGNIFHGPATTRMSQRRRTNERES